MMSRRDKSGGSAVTLGRLSLFIHPREFKKLATLTDGVARDYLLEAKWGDNADSFFRIVLGFDSVDSIDISDFEGATIQHDLGTPLPAVLQNKFDLAVDGGTLEHVFNFPVGIANLMQLVRVGGSVYLHGPANNLAGHGFYQYSPELMYRIFNPANGYKLEFVRLVKGRNISPEQTAFNPIYEVVDPDQVGRRVSLCTSRPVTIIVLATKIDEKPPFSDPVLQSDYVSAWHDEKGEVSWLKRWVSGRAPGVILSWLLGLRGRYRASFFNRKSFKRVK